MFNIGDLVIAKKPDCCSMEELSKYFNTIGIYQGPYDFSDDVHVVLFDDDEEHFYKTEQLSLVFTV